MSEETKTYYLNGNLESIQYHDGVVLHREDGPAVIDFSIKGFKKSETYFRNGIKHREDGPAVIDFYADGDIFSQSYFKNGKLHREDGPAIIEYHPARHQVYYLNNGKYSELEYKGYLRNKQLDKLDIK